MRALQWITLLLLATSSALARDEISLDQHSMSLETGIKMPESKEGITGVRLVAKLTVGGEGKGTLELNPNTYEYDEFGYASMGYSLPQIKLDCTLQFVKKGTIKIPESGRIAAPEIEIEWSFYEIKGPKLVSKLFLLIESRQVKQQYPSARILVHNSEGKVKGVFHMITPGPPEPCHPGCFPVGTQITVANGSRPVETIKVGDSITTVSATGKEGTGIVSFVFVTKNRLLEVRTEAGVLVTTVTQPLALTNGTLRAASELKPGDQIYRWVSGKRVAVRVESVETTARYESVFNVVLGEPTLFIANGYLARSKPPAE